MSPLQQNVQTTSWSRLPHEVQGLSEEEEDIKNKERTFKTKDIGLPLMLSWLHKTNRTQRQASEQASRGGIKRGKERKRETKENGKCRRQK